MKEQLPYREKYTSECTSNNDDLPIETLENKLDRYFNTLEPVPKSTDVYDFEDDDEQKTYTLLQPTQFTAQNSQQVSRSLRNVLLADS